MFGLYRVKYYEVENGDHSYFDKQRFSHIAKRLGSLVRNGENSSVLDETNHSIVVLKQSTYPGNTVPGVFVWDYDAYVLAGNRLVVLTMRKLTNKVRASDEKAFLRWVEEVHQVNEGQKV